MSEIKLSSDEVPPMFAEWLLAMGCPPANVPPLDKVTEMCRGQYYMVWRSLMEKVESKDIIKNKRLQVFCDDVKKCQKHSVFNEQQANVVVPQELSLWRQHSQLKEKVADAEIRVTREKENLQQIMDKVSSKLSHRILYRKRLEDAQRKVWLLQHVREEIKKKKADLEETKTIADSLCGLDEGVDIESKLEKCVQALSRQSGGPAGPGGANSKSGSSLLSVANPVACSSIASTTSEYSDEDVMSPVVKCRGDVLFQQLYEKRAGVCGAIPVSTDNTTVQDNSRISPQSVVSQTAGLQCSLALEAMKNRVHIKVASKRLASAIQELYQNHLSEEASELVVVRCEKAYSGARVAAIRALCEEVTTREGIFASGAQHKQESASATHIHSVDRIIKSKRDELRRLVTSAATIERKTQNVKECLVSLFNTFHEDAVERDTYRFEGGGSSHSGTQESISSLRQFYEEKRDRRKNKVELSMELDVSDTCSFTDPTDNGNPKFVDELKLFLKKFNLEQNRKLVLESGEKIWIFESVYSSVLQLHAKWQKENITTSLLCPSLNLTYHLHNLAEHNATKLQLEGIVRGLDNGARNSEMDLDLGQTTNEEEKTLDKIKKRLNSNILSLQKTTKCLDTCMENLHLWSNNSVRSNISDNRTVGGKPYWEYERCYLESIQM